jgi:cellulose synthase/poly-beta-1,6-N-acetylglucosamine synthase-like glycosyltransferase
VANGNQADEIASKVKHWFGHDCRICVISTKVRHLNFSLSLGLHVARAGLIARMDTDDIAQPDRLEKQVDFMLNNPSVAVLGTQYQVIDDNDQVVSEQRLPTDNRAIRDSMFWGNPLCHPSVMFRRDVVLEAGAYIGGLYAEDYDLWARLSQNKGLEFANLPGAYLKYREAGVGNARGAKLAYASMASSQYRNFVAGYGWKWGLASLLSWGKAIFKGKA